MSIRPHLLCWCESAPPRQAQLQREPLPVPMWQRQTIAVGIHGGRCLRASWRFLGVPRALQPGPIPFRDEGRKTPCCNMFAPDMVLPRGSVSVFLCFRITILALLLKQQQRKWNIGLCGCQCCARQNLSCLLVGRHQMVVGLCVVLFPLLFEKL